MDVLVTRVICWSAATVLLSMSSVCPFANTIFLILSRNVRGSGFVTVPQPLMCNLYDSFYTHSVPFHPPPLPPKPFLNYKNNLMMIKPTETQTLNRMTASTTENKLLLTL